MSKKKKKKIPIHANSVLFIQSFLIIKNPFSNYYQIVAGKSILFFISKETFSLELGKFHPDF